MRHFITFLLTILVVGPTLATGDSTEVIKNLENYSELSLKLNQAVEERNFLHAREALEEILPIMKDDIKESKKTLHHIGKTENPPMSEKEYQKVYDRKEEIYETIKHFKDLSSASLRVKSSLIASNIQEYGKLMQNDLLFK